MADALYAAWLAGFFDGEGSVRIAHKSGALQVSIYQSDRSVLESIQGAYGGVIGIHLRKGSQVKGSKYKATKDAWELHFNLLDARTLLRDIAPYARVKRPQIELALDYISTIMSLVGLRGRPGRGHWHHLSSIERQARAEFSRRLVALNRGNSPIPAEPKQTAKPQLPLFD